MRRAVAVITIVWLMAAPVAWGTGTVTVPASPDPQAIPRLDPTVPWLTPTATTPTPRGDSTHLAAASTPTATTGTTGGRGDLPFTGDDLAPESILAGALVASGILLRLRWHRPG